MYANPRNELWLDFKTNSHGSGYAFARVDFLIRPGEAKAVVIHDRATDMNGVAGPKLACVDVPFAQ
jgi:Cu-Zn family superoxide dismutase